MRAVFVGSRALDLKLAVGPLFTELLNLPPESQIFLRKPKNGSPRAFEELVERISIAMGYGIIYMQPEGKGREGTYARDMALVERAEVVFAFFPPDHVMTGGTGHVVEKAIDENIPCYAYRVDDDGHARWVGGIEPPEDDAILAAWNRRSASPVKSSSG